MKKYTTPEIEKNVICTNDIMSLSANEGDAASDNNVSVSLDDGFWG